MSDLYLISAGAGTRMGINIPKALAPIHGIPCLTTTLNKIVCKFDNVFVVYNQAAERAWLDYFADIDCSNFNNVKPIGISSGLGDGHALMMAMENAYPSADITVAWGDVYFPFPQIIDELLSREFSRFCSGFIPAVRKENPYVTLLVDALMNCRSADFSKYGESHLTGFHDQSVFRFKRENIYTSLTDMHAAFWKNGRYITPGGELSLLYCFHHLYNVEQPMQVYETAYPTCSFNTLEELEKCQSQYL